MAKPDLASGYFENAQSYIDAYNADADAKGRARYTFEMEMVVRHIFSIAYRSGHTDGVVLGDRTRLQRIHLALALPEEGQP